MLSSDKNFSLILGVRIFSRRKDEVLEYIEKYLEKGKRQKAKGKVKRVRPFVIFTPNSEIIVYAQKDKNFCQILNRADMMLPDGIGVVWAARLFKNQEVAERITGIDFMLELVQLAKKKGLTIGLIGGRNGVALSSLECLKKKFANLVGWAMDGPEFQISNFKFQISNERRNVATLDSTIASIMEVITSRETDILFVGLGHPKQEYFIEALWQRLVETGYHQPIVLMAVGGAFDILSGRISRAPKWMQQSSLEWLYRLVRQPWRIRRQIALFEFIILVFRQFLKRKRSFSPF